MFLCGRGWINRRDFGDQFWNNPLPWWDRYRRSVRDHSRFLNDTSIGFKYLYPRLRITINQLCNSLKRTVVLAISNDVREGLLLFFVQVHLYLGFHGQWHGGVLAASDVRDPQCEVNAYAGARLQDDPSPLGSSETPRL